MLHHECTNHRRQYRTKWGLMGGSLPRMMKVRMITIDIMYHIIITTITTP